MPIADITPTTELVQSWRQQLPRWSTIFGELIDNAFDAAATQIRITLDNTQTIVVADNGIGCPDLALMLTAGHHTSHKTTRLGRYGIGFKQAVASAGDTVNVLSIHDGIQRSTEVSWARLASSGTWSIELGDPLPTTARSGTTITIGKLRNKTGLNKEQFTKLLDHLSEQYTPAIKQGWQIIVDKVSKSTTRSTTLHAAELPPLEQTRNVELSVGPKRATLLIGLLPEGVSYARSGLTVSYGFRVIERGVRWGLGDEPTPGLLGWLDLRDGWDLSTNKEHIFDAALEGLAKQISERCADVIARAVKRGLSIPLQDASSHITAMLERLQAHEGLVKERRRSPGSSTGTRRATSTGKRRLHATLTQPGQVFLREMNDTPGIKISLSKRGEESGLYNYQEGGIIELNLDNPIICARRHDREFLAITALHALAGYAVLEGHDQRRFRFARGKNDYEDLSRITGEMMRHLPPLHEEPSDA